MRIFSPRIFLLVLMVGYPLLLIGVIGGLGYCTFLLGQLGWNWLFEVSIQAGGMLFFATAVLGFSVLSLAVACLGVFERVDYQDPLELHLPPKGMKGLMKLVRSVADDQSLPMPDLVCLHAESLAHVYDRQLEGERCRVLVIGVSALASLDRKSIGGIVAHELGHFAGGDTALSRQAQRWNQVMYYVEMSLSEQPYNPFSWLIRGYHFLYRWAWAMDQRDREYKADRYQVDLVGVKQAARTLVTIHSIEEMPWSRLNSVVEWYATMPGRQASLFDEQMKRAKQVKPQQWEEACQRALKRKTKMFDSHPCLRERLRSIGVSPKKALGLAGKIRQADTDPSKFIMGWDIIEQAASGFLIELVQQEQEVKKDMAAIILGRPVPR